MHNQQCAAIIPECALLVYCGTLAKNVRDVVNGTAGSGGSMAWVLGGLSVVTCVGAAAWATVVARCVIMCLLAVLVATHAGTCRRAIKRAEAHISITRSAEESGSAVRCLVLSCTATHAMLLTGDTRETTQPSAKRYCSTNYIKANKEQRLIVA